MRPLGVSGRRPDVNTLCFKGRGIRRIVSEALARQYLTSRGAGLAERGACCAPDKPVFSVRVCCVCLVPLIGSGGLLGRACETLRATCANWSHRFCMATMQIRFDLHSEK